MHRSHLLCTSLVTVLALAACGPTSTTDGGDAATDAATEVMGLDAPDVFPGDDGGGPVNGPADMHCTVDGGAIVNVPDPAACMPGAVDGSVFDAGAPLDLGVPVFNGEGDDDGCKYHVDLTGTTLARSTPVTFIITISNKSDGSPVVGARPGVELILDPRQTPMRVSQTPQEAASGVYQVGPVRFNASGDWIVRFNLFESCTDGPDSPRGHISFLLHVP